MQKASSTTKPLVIAAWPETPTRFTEQPCQPEYASCRPEGHGYELPVSDAGLKPTRDQSTTARQIDVGVNLDITAKAVSTEGQAGH